MESCSSREANSCAKLSEPAAPELQHRSRPASRSGESAEPEGSPRCKSSSHAKSDERDGGDPGDAAVEAPVSLETGSSARCGSNGTSVKDASAEPSRCESPSGLAKSAPFHLSNEDIKRFEEDGFVMIKRAFDPVIAAAAREHLWRRMQAEGVTKDPSTWPVRKGIAEIYGTPTSPRKRRGEPWTSALSPRLKKAIDQLVGIGAWETFGCGWWVVTFPGFATGLWRAEGKWHIDGAHFRHYPHSREIGLLPIFLFSDVRPNGGGTALLRGSHKRVAEILWKKSGTTGMKGPQLSTAARELLLPPDEQDVVETTGEAGDVMLTHPLLLHARSTNLAPEEEAGVRFMCHPAVPLKSHLDFSRPPETFSAVERVIWHSRSRSSAAEGNPALPIVTPDQCDHSPVQLPSARGNVGYGRKRKRSIEGGSPVSGAGRQAQEEKS